MFNDPISAILSKFYDATMKNYNIMASRIWLNSGRILLSNCVNQIVKSSYCIPGKLDVRHLAATDSHLTQTRLKCEVVFFN